MTIDWDDKELISEIIDQVETLDSLLGRTPNGFRGKMPVGHLRTRRMEAAAQHERSLKAYGADRGKWPAGSAHAMRSTEREIEDLDGRVSVVVGNLVEYVAELRRRLD